MSRQSLQTHVHSAGPGPRPKVPGGGYSLTEPPLPVGPGSGAFPTAESVKQNWPRGATLTPTSQLRKRSLQTN